MPDDLHGMRLALEEARRAYQCGEVPIGAVILDDAGSVISSGYNLRETEHDATAHAELIAIRRACKALGRWRLTGLTLYVTIEPCPMCESLFNITGCPGLNHQPDVCAGVLAEECAALLKNFFRERRKRF